jgi:hypothetical protein
MENASTSANNTTIHFFIDFPPDLPPVTIAEGISHPLMGSIQPTIDRIKGRQVRFKAVPVGNIDHLTHRSITIEFMFPISISD